MARTIWNGDRILADIRAAETASINEVTAAAALEAQRNHWWHSQAGRNLEHQTISEPARRVRGGFVGRFGTTRRRGFYGLFLEYREAFLRPVGDRIFPILPQRLRGNYNELSQRR